MSQSPGLGGPSTTTLLPAGLGQQQDFCFPEILLGSREWLHRLTGLWAEPGRRLQTPVLAASPLCKKKSPGLLALQRRNFTWCRRRAPCRRCALPQAVLSLPLLGSTSDRSSLERAILHVRAFWRPAHSSGGEGDID